MYELLVRYVFSPAFDFYRGAHALKILKGLGETQWWPRERIMALQNKKLGDLLGYAFENVPYYRRLFDERALKPDDIKGAPGLEKLPVLTRQVFRENFDDLMAEGFPGRSMKIYNTGGSTGEPLRFYRATQDIAGWDCAAGLRAFGWAGYRVGYKCALLCERRLYDSVTESVMETVKQFMERIVLFDVWQMSEDRLPFFIEKLKGFDGGFIQGYPSALYLLARAIKNRGGPVIRPKAIIMSGEKMYDFQKDLMAEVFGCEIFRYYRSNEINSIACECPEHAGYHISAESLIVEVVDDEGRPVPAGQQGRILVTNLHSHAMPFIRYEIGDIGALSGEECPCGRGLPLLADLSGRITDVIYTRSGKSIPGVALPLGFLASWNVCQFQVVQDTCDAVAVRIVMDNNYPQDTMERLFKDIRARYRAALGNDVDIRIELVDRIDTTPSGKRRVVISNMQ